MHLITLFMNLQYKYPIEIDDFKESDYMIKRKNQNKCYHARVATLIIVLRNIYQIFRPITLLKHVLITNQYVA